MAGGTPTSRSVPSAGGGAAVALGGIALAVVAGASATWAPLVVVLALVGAACAVRFGATTVLLHALVLSMFFESISVESIRVGRILAVVVPVYVVFRLLTGWRPGVIPRWAWLPALLFGAWTWASGLWADSIGAWQGVLGALGLAAAYFLAFACLVDTPEQVRELLRTYVLGAVVMSFVALAQAGVDVRAVGLQGDPNIFALYQVAAIPAAGMLARTSRIPWQRAAWLVLILPMIASVFASQSRGGLLTLALLLPVALIRGDFGRVARGHTAFAALATAGLLAGLAYVAGRVDDRLSIAAILRDQGTGRLDIWEAAWHGYLSAPLLGLGGGGFFPQSTELLSRTPGVDLDPFSLYFRTGIKVHNGYLEALAELGPIGLVLWLGIFAGAILVLVRYEGIAVRRTPTSPLLPMLLVFAVATTFLSVANNKLLWMVVGLTAAVASSRYTATRESEEPVRAWRPRPVGAGMSGGGPRIGIDEPHPSNAPITYSKPAAPQGHSSSGPYPKGYSPGPVWD